MLFDEPPQLSLQAEPCLVLPALWDELSVLFEEMQPGLPPSPSASSVTTASLSSSRSPSPPPPGAAAAALRVPRTDLQQLLLDATIHLTGVELTRALDGLGLSPAERSSYMEIRAIELDRRRQQRTRRANTTAAAEIAQLVDATPEDELEALATTIMADPVMRRTHVWLVMQRHYDNQLLRLAPHISATHRQRLRRYMPRG